MIAFLVTIVSVIALFVSINLFMSQDVRLIFAAFISLWTIALSVLTLVVEIQDILVKK